MNSKKILSFTAMVILILPVFSSAQERINERVRTRTEAELEAEKIRLETREQVRVQNQERVLEIREETQQRRSDAQNEMHRKMLNLHQRTTEVYSLAIIRLNKLAERIDSRIKKIEEMGIDMTESRNLLTQAETKITEANQKVGSLNINGTVSFDNRAEVISKFNNYRQEIQEARRLINEAHRALILVVENIKLGQLRLEAESEL